MLREKKTHKQTKRLSLQACFTRQGHRHLRSCIEHCFTLINFHTLYVEREVELTEGAVNFSRRRSLIEVDVSPIRASSTPRIPVLGIKFTKSEKALKSYKTIAYKSRKKNKKYFT